MAFKNAGRNDMVSETKVRVLFPASCLAFCQTVYIYSSKKSSVRPGCIALTSYVRLPDGLQKNTDEKSSVFVFLNIKVYKPVQQGNYHSCCKDIPHQ